MALALVVDRDAGARLSYATPLRGQAYEIDEADDGRDALAKALAFNPALIVTGARLPGISGIELCRLLRRDAVTGGTPIIVVADPVASHDVDQARAAGADLVILKPDVPERLPQAIGHLRTVSVELQDRSRAARERAAAQVARSHELMTRSREAAAGIVLSHVHRRGPTVTPPAPPPHLTCPACDRPLRYLQSQIGGVSARYPEQWDYFE